MNKLIIPAAAIIAAASLAGCTQAVTYVVEDISGAEVSSTRYQISYLPEAIIPVELKAGK